jgi:DNA-binding SARP family transcriptional activator
VAVYRGDLLQNCDAEWLLPVRERLRRAFFAGLERLILLLESEREYRAAIEAAHRLVDEDPLHEASYRYLMRLYKATGDRASALHA